MANSWILLFISFFGCSSNKCTKWQYLVYSVLYVRKHYSRPWLSSINSRHIRNQAVVMVQVWGYSLLLLAVTRSFKHASSRESQLQQLSHLTCFMRSFCIGVLSVMFSYVESMEHYSYIMPNTHLAMATNIWNTRLYKLLVIYVYVNVYKLNTYTPHTL